MLAPIILFVYNRKSHTAKTVEALKKNFFAKESVLYVFCDGPKSDATDTQLARVSEVQEFVQHISGFKEVHIERSDINKGLANSVIDGVTKVIKQYGKAIIVEDDIITTPHFLRFMNECLDVYADRHDIFMIGGFNYPFEMPKGYSEDIYVVHRSCTWGWATWKDRWDLADWNVNDYDLMCNNKNLRRRFNRGGRDMFPMLEAQMEGKIDSWGIRWDYSMYKNDGLCVHPVNSLCTNIGFDGSGVHCGISQESLNAELYKSNNYSLKLNWGIEIDKKLEKRFALFQAYGNRSVFVFYLRIAINKILSLLKY